MSASKLVKKQAQKVEKKAEKKVEKKAESKIVSAPAKKSVAPAVVKVTSNQTTVKKLEPKKLVKPLIFLLILAAIYLIKDEVIVASVNGKPVTRWSLVSNLEKQYAPTILESMTLQMLVEQELQKAKIEISDEEMDAEITKIEEQLAAQGQNLDDLLEAQGLNRKEVKEQLALSKGLEKLLADKIVVSDDEVQAYFDQNKEAMGADVKLEDVSADIKTQLRQQKLGTEQQKWFAEIKKTAKVNYYKFTPSTNL